MAKSYTRKDIPVDINDIIKPDQLSQWKYLDKIKGKLCGKKDIKIDLLIGANCARVLEPEVVIPSKDGGLMHSEPCLVSVSWGLQLVIIKERYHEIEYLLWKQVLNYCKSPL